MSLISSMYAGASGLSAASAELNVVGDNISNANTVGFKGSRASFEDALSQTLIGSSGASSQVGRGTRLASVQRIISQGALLNTGVATDLALQGPGVFVLKGAHNGRDGTFFTRAGNFQINKDGLLTNLEGLRVQGFLADDAGAVSKIVGDLRVGSANDPPKPTGKITVKANLQSDVVLTAAWDLTKPTGTSNFSTTSTVYDSLGKAHELQIYYRRSGAGAWEWHAITDGAGVQGGTAGTAVEVASGTLTFDPTGKLSAETNTSNFNPVGAVQPQALAFDFGDPTSSNGTGLKGITQFANPSSALAISQDGHASAGLVSINVEVSGNVVGTFANGQSRVLGAVSVAQFDAADQLERVGGNLLIETRTSGQPTVGTAGTGGRGGISAGFLEQSNVDLASEFIRMIAAQRGFQANSKTITTADQLLNDLISLKR
jgi:flagellar hook protein FlgE